jgi:negative regulator of sigma E activity
MNDDYLWDKSGEPDPQIQELEDILGTLRYQPRPLKLGGSSTARRRNYLALLAIAATVAVALLAGGLWLLLPQHDASIPAVAYVTPATPIRIGDLPLSVSPPASPKRHPRVLARRDREEALAAKQQLMFALRMASEKLNTAYRRTQTPSQIKNQHKAG